MKRLLIFLLACCLSLWNCIDQDYPPNGCYEADQVEELDWLAAAIDTFSNCYCRTSIMQGAYPGEIVFFIRNTSTISNSS